MAAPDQRRDGVTHYSYGEGEGPQKIGTWRTVGRHRLTIHMVRVSLYKFLVAH